MNNNNNRFIATVSQVNRRVSLNLKNDKVFADLYVKGEVSNFVCHYKSGHIYFTLKDAVSALKCVMFAHEAEKLEFMPENGQSIIARGTIGVFERDGIYQLYISALEQEETEEENLYKAFLKLKEKLLKEGVFDNARSLPQYPDKICLITSKDGAALQDMLSVFARRYPVLEVLLIPAAVQGKTAPASVIKALKAANSVQQDLIIIARGGGSAEDLWAFNDEALAREIYASKIPVISAIGHETDFTIADFAADMRAPTPTAAAELATPDLSDLEFVLDNLLIDLKRRISGIIDRKLGRINILEHEIKRSMKNIFLYKKSRVEAICSLIEALSPEKVFARGYAAVFAEGKALKNAADVQIGDKLKVKLSEGSLSVIVRDKNAD